MNIRTRATSAFAALAALAVIIPISATSSATDWRRETEARSSIADKDVIVGVEHVGTNFNVDVLMLDSTVNESDHLAIDIRAPGGHELHTEAQLAKRFTHEIYGMRTRANFIDVDMNEKRAISVDLTWTKDGVPVGKTSLTTDAI